MPAAATPACLAETPRKLRSRLVTDPARNALSSAAGISEFAACAARNYPATTSRAAVQAKLHPICAALPVETEHLCHAGLVDVGAPGRDPPFGALFGVAEADNLIERRGAAQAAVSLDPGRPALIQAEPSAAPAPWGTGSARTPEPLVRESRALPRRLLLGEPSGANFHRV